MKKYKNFLLIIAFSVFILLFGSQKLFAQAPTDYVQCGGENPATAIISLPTGQYDVYAKLNVKDTQEAALVYAQELSVDGSATPCKQIASTTVNDKTYAKVASAVAFTPTLTNVAFASASTTSMQSAAAPQLVLVPSGTTICTLTTDCTITYQGQTMSLSPKKLSLTSDSLRVGLLSSVDKQKIKTVVYSIDSKPAYEQSSLQPFNESYVSGGEHTLTRRVVFESGATVSDTRTLEHGTIADLHYTAIAMYQGQSKIIKIVLITGLVLVVLALTKVVARAIYKRRLWRRTHIASASTYTISSENVGAQKNFYDEPLGRTIYRYRKWLYGSFGLVFGVIILTTYVIGIFTVDGVSMLPTLQDTSVRPLLKINKTIASINRSQYLPKRGDIVVVHKDENNLFEPIGVQQKTYVVKRVVGLPGERVTVKNGKIVVYNTEHKDGYEPDAQYKWTTMLEGSEQFNIDITLKDSELFVVGDHRDESIDSRFYGPVDSKEVVGKVL